MRMNGSRWIHSFALVLGLPLALWLVASTSARAQKDSLRIDDNRVGIDTANPSHSREVRATNGTARVFIEEQGGGSSEYLSEICNDDGDVGVRLRDWAGVADFNKIGKELRINLSSAELTLQADGDLIITGTYTPRVTALGTFRDFVFEPDRLLLQLLGRIEDQTVSILEQKESMETFRETIRTLEQRLEALEERP